MERSFWELVATAGESGSTARTDRYQEIFGLYVVSDLFSVASPSTSRMETSAGVCGIALGGIDCALSYVRIDALKRGAARRPRRASGWENVLVSQMHQNHGGA